MSPTSCVCYTLGALTICLTLPWVFVGVTFPLCLGFEFLLDDLSERLVQTMPYLHLAHERIVAVYELFVLSLGGYTQGTAVVAAWITVVLGAVYYVAALRAEAPMPIALDYGVVEDNDKTP